MGNFDTTKWFKNQYIKEHVINESVTINLNDLTFDMVTDTFKDKYKNVHFTRMQPDGKEGPSYKDAVHFPNPDDSLTLIGDMKAFESWKEGTLQNMERLILNYSQKKILGLIKLKSRMKNFKKIKMIIVKLKLLI